MMNIFDNSRRKAVVFDGAMGTMLQKMGLSGKNLPETVNISNPDGIRAIHRAYIDAGAEVISSNSFGANKAKLAPFGLDAGEITEKAVAIARSVADEYERKILVAADLGPTGKLMPPLGDFSFEEAVDAFSVSVEAAEKAGADFIFFETFSDLYECKAAVISARENSSLPVAVSLTFDESGRTLTGADAETAAVYLSALGVDAIGVNCCLGPDAMEPIAIKLAQISGLPVIVNANAGLPKLDSDGNTYFDIPPERFDSFARSLAENGVFGIGGCCGTDPGYISRVAQAVAETEKSVNTAVLPTAVCSGTSSYFFGEKTAVVGERLNPTGKPKLKAAIKNRDMDYLCAEAVAQQAAGADILDVNVGIPDIDESAVLPKAVIALQKVTELPLQLDSASPEALAAAARVYNGIPIINSVSGKEEILNSVLPVIKKYGGMAVALLLDDAGIPDTAEGRLAIANKIIARAEDMGISRNRLLFDALTMTVATDSESGAKTLECVKRLSERGLHTALGVSNISFGMPNREIINASFLGAAIARGLSAAITNPASETAKTVLADPNPNPNFVFKYENAEISDISTVKNNEMSLFDAVFHGLTAKSAEAAEKLLDVKAPLEIIESQLIPALNALGKDYEEKRIFLPRLLGGAEAAKAAFKVINKTLSAEGAKKGMKIVIATVHGDIHDIGKNIVATLLSNYGFEVIDLGKDVPPETVLEAAIAHDAKIVGLSALMTTTVPAMAETVRLVHSKMPEAKVMVGGAVLTREYADEMGADFYGEDAMASVKYALAVAESLNYKI